MSKRGKAKREAARTKHHSKISLARPIIAAAGIVALSVGVIAYAMTNASPVKIYETELSPVSCQLKQQGNSSQLVTGNSNDSNNYDEADRVVRLTAGTLKPSSEGSANYTLEQLGTGYDIGSGIVVTARHVVEEDSGKLLAIAIFNPSDKTGTLGYVVATHSKSDIALVKYSGKKDFSGVLIGKASENSDLDALVIDGKPGVTFDGSEVKRFGFTKMDEVSPNSDSLLSHADFGRPGMSGAALLTKDGRYTGTLVRDYSRMNVISYGIGFNETGTPFARPPVESKKQVIQSTSVRPLVQMLEKLCGK